MRKSGVNSIAGGGNGYMNGVISGASSTVVSRGGAAGMTQTAKKGASEQKTPLSK